MLAGVDDDEGAFDGALSLFPMSVALTPIEFSLASLGASLFELTVNVMQYK